ncbi:glycosyltransferase family 2 protein [Arenimonas sp.]|uniref:glycosyltransferase family 2 protein n=1 Tax=Arenimonas sp. TaxID=1872635 RepID=UPI0035B3389B
MSAPFSPVVVVPVFDHPQAIAGLVETLRGLGVPCLLVDDGSGPECAALLAGLAHRHPDAVSLVRLETNQGKGAAVMAGLREAGRRGFSHALQIDADGQHDARDVPRFLAMARETPDAVINGRPIYDQSVPRARLYGRYASHVWVWINTLSLAIRDSMCGFRVYPLAPTVALIDREHIGTRMDFDTEIIVRLYWQGLAVRDCPTRVTYPEHGVSHFRMLRDNVRISAMHTRLFFGMLLRLPRLLARKVRG